MRHTFNRTASPFPLSFRTRTGVSFGGGEGGRARSTHSFDSIERCTPDRFDRICYSTLMHLASNKVNGSNGSRDCFTFAPPLPLFSILFAVYLLEEDRDLLVSRVILNNPFFCISLLLLMEWCLTLEHCSIKVVGKLVDELKSMQY